MHIEHIRLMRVVNAGSGPRSLHGCSSCRFLSRTPYILVLILNPSPYSLHPCSLHPAPTSTLPGEGRSFPNRKPEPETRNPTPQTLNPTAASTLLGPEHSSAASSAPPPSHQQLASTILPSPFSGALPLSNLILPASIESTPSDSHPISSHRLKSNLTSCIAP